MALTFNCLFVLSLMKYEADCWLKNMLYYIVCFGIRYSRCKVLPCYYLEKDMCGWMLLEWSFSVSLFTLSHWVLFSAIVQSKMVREMTETGESVFRCLDCDHRSKRSADLAKHIDAKERFHLILRRKFLSRTSQTKVCRLWNQILFFFFYEG